ncbi:MAG TPA: PAS domain-containing protein [Longimicrobium sp.]
MLRTDSTPEERYRAFVEQSSEGIWCFEFDPPVPLDVPMDEQIEHAYRHGVLLECNDAMARMYGYEHARRGYWARSSR